MADSRMLRAERFVNDRFNDVGFKTSDVAKYIGLDYSVLVRQFKQHAGVTLSEYILSLRMGEAKVLLTASAYSVKEIASMVGYGCLSSFCGVFKRYCGQTPLKFRQAAYGVDNERRG